MPPIDPLQLLSALSPLLSEDGGMKSEDEVVKLASLMKKFSKKLVSRCVYVQILKVTEPDILQKFLDEGGWDIVNNWLKEAKEKEDHGFLVELLELYKCLPMTVDKLKENNSARIIKGFCKSDNENIKKSAQEIVDAWMKLVKKERGDAAEKKPKKKKHVEKKEILPNNDQEGALKAPSNQVVPTKKGTIKIKKIAAEKKPDKLTKSLKRTNTDDLEDAKPMIVPTEKPIKKVKKKERPSTVKTYRASFRATGLEDEPLSDKPVNKKGKVGEKQVPILTIKRPLNPVSELNSPPEKKIKPASLITPASSKTDSTNILSPKIPTISKPKPVHHVLQDSTGFMDALVAAPPPPVKKKKKVTTKNNSNEVTSPSTPIPPSSVESKPQFQFYKDTLESPSDKEPDSDIKLTGEGERTPSPPVDKEEQDKENVNQESSDESPLKEKSLPKSNLKLIGSKKKKSVRWAEDSELKEFFYFILDENERVNVNNLKNFGDMKNKELQMEKQALLNARKSKGDLMEEQMMWITPPLIDGINHFDYGANSTEKETQRLRQEGVLQYIFLSKSSSIESPMEPDPDSKIVNTNTKIIPLKDETNQDAVNDYSNFNLMSNNNFVNQDLPPALSNLMISLSTNNQVNQPNMMNQQPNDMGMMQQPMQPQQQQQQQHQQQQQQPPFDQFFNENGFNNQGMDNRNGPNMQNMMMGRGGPMDGPPIRHPPNMRMMGPPGPRGPMRGMGPNMRQPWRGSGPRGPPRGGGLRPRGGIRFQPYVPCRNFMQDGSCQFGDKCRFLHPGINGPPL